MAKDRKNQAAVIRFGPALKAAFLCLAITGSAVGYVWQKGEIDQLGQQIRLQKQVLAQLTRNNQRLTEQIAILHSPVKLDERVRELNLGLGPAQPGQVVRLAEPAWSPVVRNAGHQLAERSNDILTP